MKRRSSVGAEVVLWADVEQLLSVRAKALVEAARSRGDIKRLGAWLDEVADDALREAVVRLGEARGVDFSEERASIPGKRLLRLARGHEEQARERKNPIHRDEAFTCAACGRAVPPHGRTARDHCPWCLCSLHVDRVPGDRAEDCGGLLQPVTAELRGDDVVLHYRCATCGAARTNRALLDGDPSDDWTLLTRIAAREGGRRS